MTENEQRLPSENPYAAPASTLVDSRSEPIKSAEEQHLRTFVGSKADYYLEKWNLLLDPARPGAGFNAAAFFLSGLWLAYRKMYRVAAVFYAAVLVEAVAEEVVFVGILGRAEAPRVSGAVVGLVAAIICGTYGNRWYLSHARRAISVVRTQGLEGDAIVETLSKRGGTSLGSSLGFLLLYMIVMFAVFVVLALFFH